MNATPTTADVVAELRRLKPHSQVLRFFDELEQEPRAGASDENSKSNPPDCADTRSAGARLILGIAAGVGAVVLAGLIMAAFVSLYLWVGVLPI